MKITEIMSLDDNGNEVINVCVDYENGNFLWTKKSVWDEQQAKGDLIS